MADDAAWSGEPNTTAVRPAHSFDQSLLEKYLALVLPEFAGPMTVTQFATGQSNPTFLLSTPGHKYVLRKKPPGDLLPSAHQIEREFKIMSALKQSCVAVPEVLHLCQDASVIGTNFFVMRYVQGRIFSHPTLPGLSQEERAQIYQAACRMLVALHSVDIEAVGLSDYGRRESFVSRQLSRWTKQYLATRTDQIDEMDRVIEWLTANIPAGDDQGQDVTIVHGDFRLDNMIFHPDRPEILAVLDWELSTLGNPLADLGYFSMLYHLPGDVKAVPGLAGADLATLGIPDEHTFVHSYLQGSGRDSAQSAQQRYFLIFSLFRLAAIAQGVYARAKQGVASSADAEAVGRMARPCAQIAWSLVPR
jgi:aminoglycoside phosphotransferase (APT) family kinase protein